MKNKYICNSYEWKKWFPFSTYDLESNLCNKMVFCFHHAGGNAAAYRKWTLPKGKVNFVCVELPGKGTRRKEKYISDFSNMVHLLCESIVMAADHKKFFLFGHSMGAAIAFYVAAYLEKYYKISPEKVIVAGRQPPNEENQMEFKTYMDDIALVEELKKYNATPKEVLENKELLNFILPEIRRDYKLNESLLYHGECLHIPLIMHSGKEDKEADMSIMKRWQSVTTEKTKLEEFNGGHFFILDLETEYWKSLENEITKE